MNDLNFTDSEKLRIVLNSTSSKRRLMTLDDSEKMDAVIASYYGEDYKTNPRYVGDNFSPIGSDYVIDGETILSSYKDLFNEEVKDYNLTLDNCPVFKYDANANMYLILRGCWNGPDVPVTLFSKDKYVVDGDKVIVYVGIANYTKTYDSKTYEVVKTAIYKGIDDSGAIIKNVNINLGDDEAIIDAINEYKNEFEKYKFVFEKNSEGTYSFKELSKA